MASNVDLFRKFTPAQTMLDIPPLRTGVDAQVQEAGEELLRKVMEEAEKAKAEAAKKQAIQKLTQSLGQRHALPNAPSLSPIDRGAPVNAMRAAASKTTGALDILSRSLRFAGQTLGGLQLALYSSDVGEGSDIVPTGPKPESKSIPPSTPPQVSKQGPSVNNQPSEVTGSAQSETPQTSKYKVIAEIDPRAHSAGTFGNYEIERNERGNRIVVEKETKPVNTAPTISVQAELDRQVTKSTASGLTKELDIISKLDGPARMERTLQLFQTIEEAKARRLAELQTVAEVRSGYQEAQEQLDSVKKLERLTGFAAKKPGKMSTEQKESWALVNSTSVASARLLEDLTKSDPEFQQLDILGRRLAIYDQKMTQSETRQLEKKDLRELEMGDITPTKIAAFRIMYDVPPEQASDEEVRTTIHAKRKNDKQFAALIEIERANALDYLSHKDKFLRDKAAKFLITAAKLPPDSPEALFIKQFAADRTIALDKTGKQDLAEIKLGTPGAQEKLDLYDSKVRSSLEQGLLNIYENQIGNLSTWNVADPELKKIISDLSLANKAGRVEFRDIVKQYIGNSLGDERQQKLTRLSEELTRRVNQDAKNNFLPLDYSASLLKFRQQLKIEADRSLASIMLNGLTSAIKAGYSFTPPGVLGSASSAIGQSIFGSPSSKE